MPSVLLWLFVIDLGIVCGAGLYEARIVVPMWRVSAMLEPDTGRRFWAFVSTVPLSLLTIGNLVVAWEAPAPQRGWWLFAVAVVTLERVSTFAYFIPTALQLQRAETADREAVRARLTTWSRVNWVRNAASLIAWLAALQALSLG